MKNNVKVLLVQYKGMYWSVVQEGEFKGQLICGEDAGGEEWVDVSEDAYSSKEEMEQELQPLKEVFGEFHLASGTRLAVVTG